MNVRKVPTAHGFMLATNVDAVPKDCFPSMFINVVRKKKQWNFTTLDILKHNDRLRESLLEICLMSEK